MPPPLRKLSQGKVDKTTSSSASVSQATGSGVERTFLKKGSEKTFKLATSVTEEEQQPLVQKSTSANRFRDKSISEQNSKLALEQSSNLQQIHHEIENEEEVVFDLPPPMKPIQDSQAIINNGSNAPTSSAVEQSPCKRVNS